jgi:hypothetical protein
MFSPNIVKCQCNNNGLQFGLVGKTHNVQLQNVTGKSHRKPGALSQFLLSRQGTNFAAIHTYSGNIQIAVYRTK